MDEEVSQRQLTEGPLCHADRCILYPIINRELVKDFKQFRHVIRFLFRKIHLAETEMAFWAERTIWI